MEIREANALGVQFVHVWGFEKRMSMRADIAVALVIG